MIIYLEVIIITNCNSQPVTALITGASGFIGSRLTQRLVRNGWNVHTIVRPTSNLNLLDSVIDKIKIHYYTNSFTSLSQIVEKVSPDITFHLASVATIHYTPPENIRNMLDCNVTFGTELVEAISSSGTSHFINTGTFSQHFDQQDYNPNSLYAATKQAFEDILCYYSETNRLKALTLTLFDNYGPFDPRPKIMNLLYSSYVDNKPLVMTPGEQYLDLVFIDDVIDAYIVAANRLLYGNSKTQEKFVVSSGELIQLKQLVTEFESIIGKELPITWGGIDYRPREIMIPWRRGTPLPHWYPRVSLKEGIKSFLKNNQREEKQEDEQS
ncbi:NAD-dependent epimerase/dehydratase family protein [Gracilibacillus sp. JCM 18860]|uniref:NAD-dependent epimerase/dehydratase family protein n=1 Tax=Gracilibacillus sp. JCM 18860 TaxID=1306159 RepID=UPI0006D24692